ncbi:MAG TPA: hypothetical protein VMS38_10270 [Pseudorhodoferax sp.]|jgi:hypothetical protein|nr:hypothetical protein [Pseudorhodoferax sp.]
MYRRPRSFLAALLALSALLAWAPAHAQANARANEAVPAPRGEWTLYGGQMIHNDLPPLAFDLVTGRVRTKSAYLVGVGYGLPLPAPPTWLSGGLSWIGVHEATAALDLIAVQHGGAESNPEIDLGYTLRSRYAAWGPAQVRVGAGLGPSLALGRPSAEDGPNDTSPRRPRLQTYIGLELEARMEDLPATGLVLRVHHRSSAYGLVATKNVGGNFIVLGLRHSF